MDERSFAFPQARQVCYSRILDMKISVRDSNIGVNKEPLSFTLCTSSFGPISQSGAPCNYHNSLTSRQQKKREWA